jgi:hypothetical protein
VAGKLPLITQTIHGELRSINVLSLVARLAQSAADMASGVTPTSSWVYPLTEEGSGLLIMAIAGGALSALQGLIADRVGLQLLSIACGVLCVRAVLRRLGQPCART